MSKLWTDNPRPWVNEHLSQPNQLGIAARLLSRWGKNWHKEKQDKATYDRAHNDIADLADTITSLLMDIDRLRQQVTQLQDTIDGYAGVLDDWRDEARKWQRKGAELEAALAAASQWQPLPPGSHYIEYGDVSMMASIDGSLLSMCALDDEFYNVLTIQLDPNEYRLFRRTPAAGE